MTIPLPKCWICGEDATTGEHKTKKSDLKSVFGVPTQTQPLYYHDANRRNQLVRSLDAKILKSPSRICAECNNARTQPHNLAWAYMSVWREANRERWRLFEKAMPERPSSARWLPRAPPPARRSTRSHLTAGVG
jgi:hypothetical protein